MPNEEIPFEAFFLGMLTLDKSAKQPLRAIEGKSKKEVSLRSFGLRGRERITLKKFPRPKGNVHFNKLY